MAWPEGISILVEETQVSSSGSSAAERGESLSWESPHRHGEVNTQCSHCKLQCLVYHTHPHAPNHSQSPKKGSSGALRAGRVGREFGLHGNPG